jgi:hypothetical protein
MIIHTADAGGRAKHIQGTKLKRVDLYNRKPNGVASMKNENIL